jgi:predicted transcriptional regulator
MAAKPTSVRLDEALLARLDRIGALYERSRGWLIAEAVKRFLEEEEEYNAKIDEGIRSADSEPLLTHEQVVAETDELIKSFYAKKAAE